MKNITVLGLGAMGTRLAKNFLKQGYQVSVWNRTTMKMDELVKQGASSYATPKGAVKNADVVIAMLTNVDASKQVWLDKNTGALAGLKVNAVAIEMSTLTPEWSVELASKMHENNNLYLEAPVVGSRPQAENAQLIQFVGGEASFLEQVRDVLSVNASSIYHTGKVGSGMSMKLAINGLFGIQVAALGEMLGLLDKAGIGKESAVKMLNELPTTSPALKGIGILIVGNNFTPLFPIHLVEKDFGYLQQLSKTPLVKAARETYQRAIDEGYGSDNIAGVAQLF